MRSGAETAGIPHEKCVATREETERRLSVLSGVTSGSRLLTRCTLRRSR
jgi:hypothetical protein